MQKSEIENKRLIKILAKCSSRDNGYNLLPLIGGSIYEWNGELRKSVIESKGELRRAINYLPWFLPSR